MSVILDALKKAQDERKTLAKSPLYDASKSYRVPRWPFYLLALTVFCVLLAFLMRPDVFKPTRTPAPTAKTVPEKSAATGAAGATNVTESTEKPVAAETVVPSGFRHKTAQISPSGSPQVDPSKKKRTLSGRRATDNKVSAVEPSSLSESGEKPLVAVNTVDPERIDRIYNEAVKEAGKGNVAGAKRLYQAVLAEQPGHIEALNNLGVIAMKEGDRREALFYFNRSLQYRKDYGKAYNNMGLLMMGDGQNSIAEEYFRKAIEIEKDVLEPSLNLAALLRAEKRYEEAGRMLEGLIGANVRNRPLYLSYALIKDAMGQYEEAIKFYTLYLREGGDGGERNEIIQRLRTLENRQPSQTR